MTPRTEVYTVIDTERDYQDARWGSTESTGLHSITEFLVFIKDYTEEALHIESRESIVTADPKALNNIRKVAGLAVACMEQHWCSKIPSQDVFEHYKSKQVNLEIYE